MDKNILTFLSSDFLFIRTCGVRHQLICSSDLSFSLLTATVVRCAIRLTCIFINAPILPSNPIDHRYNSQIQLIEATKYRFACWEISCFLLSADFFQNQLFRKILSRVPSECRTVWIQIRPDTTSGLIWVQTVCKVISRRYCQAI